MAKAEAAIERVVVQAPNLRVIRVTVRGDAPLVMHRFGKKALEEMRRKMTAGDRAKGKSAKPPKDFDAEYEAAHHKSSEGWIGIPAPAFRAAMISACRVAGLVMTRAKLTVFVIPDGLDQDGKPIVRISKGEPEPFEDAVRMSDGSASICRRPRWAPGWEAVVTIRYDGDQIDAQSVVNLLSRAGLQVGILEGRPDSKKSSGQGWGTFEVVATPEEGQK